MLGLGIGINRNNKGKAFQGVYPILKSGLIAWWDFEDVLDDVHHKHNLALNSYGEVGFSTGILTTQGLLTASTGTKYAGLNSIYLLPGNVKTWAGWIKIPIVTVDQVPLAMSADNSVNQAFLSITEEGKLSIIIHSTPSTPTIQLSNDTWYFVVVTFDGVSQWRLKVNTEAWITLNASLTLPESNFQMNFGYHIGTGVAIDGSFDSWGVWDYILSDTEITSLYNGGVGKQYSTL